MKNTILHVLFFLSILISFGQSDNSIVMNDPLVKEYFQEYVQEASQRGFDVQDKLLADIDYIIIVSEDIKVCELAQTNLKGKIITLDSNVLLDRLILKVNLYRELSYVLGIPYNKGSVIMDRHKDKGFSYAAFDDVEIMNIELTKIMAFL